MRGFRPYATILPLLVASALGATAMAANAKHPHLYVAQERVFGAGDALGRILDGALAPDGSAYVADVSTSQILHYTRSGQLGGRIGGPGEGPGEFRLLYRLTIRPDGHLLALDFNSSEISEFDTAGKFLGRERLPFVFAQVDRMVALPNGNIAISGVAPTPDDARGFGIHMFDPDLRHVRSFGPLPTARNPELLNYWGAGAITLTGKQLLYTLRIPYELRYYDFEGNEKSLTKAPIQFSLGPDDAIRLEVSASRRSVSSTKIRIPRPLVGFDVGGGFVLAGRSASESSGALWDLFAENGRLVESIPAPDGVKGAFAFDAETHVLWAVGEVNLEPVLFQFSIAVR